MQVETSALSVHCCFYVFSPRLNRPKFLRNAGGFNALRNGKASNLRCILSFKGINSNSIYS